MTLPEDLTLRIADEADLPAIAALRTSVDWGVQEWALRAVLRPPARCLVVVDDAGEMAGVGSGIAYGRLGWVGNMIVAAAHRRRGLGSAILQAVTAFLDDAGCERLELYATTDGRPLYARHGFELVGSSAVARLARDMPLDTDSSLRIDDGRARDLGALVAYDRPRFGGDRGVLLEMMLADEERTVVTAWDDDALVGYAWLRPDASRLGPLLADSPAVAATLVASAFERMPEAAEISLNLPPDNRAGAAWLRSLGVTLERWDGRMGRGPQIPRRDDTIYGNLVGALG